MKWGYNLATVTKANDQSSVVKAYLIGILLLIIVFYLAIWFLRSYRKGALFKHKGRLKLIDSLMLSRENVVHIVKVNDKYLLLASSNSAVSMIMELEKEDFENFALDSEENGDSGSNRSFSRYLKDKLMNGGKK